MTESSLPSEEQSTKLFQFLAALKTPAIVALAFASVACLVAFSVRAWHTPWFEQRFTPSVAVAHGQAVFHALAGGPAMNCIYGPISYLAFIPAALIPNVWGAFACGSLLSACFVLVPLYLAIRRYRQRGLGQTNRRLLGLFALAAVAFIPTLNDAACHVAPDAPAIFFLAISVLLLEWNPDWSLRKPSWTALLASSFTLALSVACKQNMVLAVPVILIGVWYFAGRSWALLYLAMGIAFGVVITLATAAIFGDLRVIYFNAVVVPSHFLMSRAKIVYGLYFAFQYGSGLLIALAGTGALCYLTRRRFAELMSRFVVVFFAIALVFVASSARTFAAWGGAANSFSHAIFFLLLGTVIVLAEIMLSADSDLKFANTLQFWVLASAYLFVAAGIPLRFDQDEIAIMKMTPAAVEAYRYDKQHPGQVYFPSNTIGVYLAEKKFYEAEWGVMNLTMSGQPLLREDALRYLPPQAKYFAVPKPFGVPEYLVPFFIPHRIPAHVAGLDNFLVFVIER
jgi:hypothetical protein